MNNKGNNRSNISVSLKNMKKKIYQLILLIAFFTITIVTFKGAKKVLNQVTDTSIVEEKSKKHSSESTKIEENEFAAFSNTESELAEETEQTTEELVLQSIENDTDSYSFGDTQNSTSSTEVCLQESVDNQILNSNEDDEIQKSVSNSLNEFSEKNSEDFIDVIEIEEEDFSEIEESDVDVEKVGGFESENEKIDETDYSGEALEKKFKPTLVCGKAKEDLVELNLGYVIDISEEEISNLQKLVLAEAENQEYKGMVATAATVVNRVKSKSFPNTVQSVIDQKNQYTSYSWVSSKKINKKIKNAVEDALMGEDPVKDVLGHPGMYFYAADSYSYSGVTVINDKKVRIDDQYFYFH